MNLLAKTYLIASPILLLAYFAFYAKRTNYKHRELRVLFTTSIKGFLSAFLFGISVVSLIYLLCSFVGSSDFIIDNLTIELLSYAIASSLMTGIIEEIVFRGIVFQSLRWVLTKRTPILVVIMVQAIFFSYLHASEIAQINYFMMTFSTAIFLAVLAFRTNALWIPMGFHFGWNFSQKIVHGIHLQRMPSLPGIATFEFNHSVISAYVMGMIAMASIVYLLFRQHKEQSQEIAVTSNA
ncbi:lysostaphin resistance A-like protein [Undibacterium curvum]|uniref:CPBP family intramembrane glutamic endopeptidase n=1 Tax=Undibacterium curvum TaxID=2762294 RepID=UPI003D0E24EA